MPINLTPYTSGQLCQGNTWSIEDMNLLVEVVAKVLIGQQRHAEKILYGVMGNATHFRCNAVNDAIQKLTLINPEEPYHRDGLLFQIFSWIAAHKAKGEKSILASPHLILAHKGFDGLQIDIDTQSRQVEAVIIFEDKATENPRDTIRDKVWPEFVEFYAGQRESELEQNISAMLSARPDLIEDVDSAIETVFWDQARKFRVSVTAERHHMSSSGQARLFKGYDRTIPDRSVDYRTGDSIYIPQLRQWMQEFSDSVILYLKKGIAPDV